MKERNRLLLAAALALLIVACAPESPGATSVPQAAPTAIPSPLPTIGPEPGVSLNGTIDTGGKAKSGTLKFTVSEDGTSIVSLGVTLNDLECDGLSAGSYSDFLGTLRAPVTEGKFAASLPAMGGMISNFKQEYKPRPTLASLSEVGKIEGLFTSPTEASGTIRIFLGIPLSRTACELGTFDWSAKEETGLSKSRVLTPQVALTAPNGPDIESFMLTSGDLPKGYAAFDVEIEFEQEYQGFVSATTHFQNGKGGLIENSLSLTAPNHHFSLEREEAGLAPVDAPTVGDASQAFLGQTEDGRTWASLWFHKGNAFFRLELESRANEATVDNAVKLARIVESRLPTQVPHVASISFPTELDQAAYAKYLQSITLGTWDSTDPSKVIATTTFEASPEFAICGEIQLRTTAPSLSLGIFDLGSQTYRLKHVHPEELEVSIPQCEFVHELPEGSYEYRVAVGETLVAALPFQVRPAAPQEEPMPTEPAEPTVQKVEPETGAATVTPPPARTEPLTAPGGVQIEGYLLASNDVPSGYRPGNITTELETDMQGERLSARTMFIGPNSSISSYLAVAAQSFDSSILETYGFGSQPAEAPVIGQGSKAYTNITDGKTPDTTIVFYKGNALVEITLRGATQSATLDTLVKLAQAAAARLPAQVPTLAPITLPEKLDRAAYGQYFKSITLGTIELGTTGMVPTTTMKSGSLLCAERVALAAVPKYSFGIYSLDSGAYILKESEAQTLVKGSSLSCSVILSLFSGKYEYRAAVGDVLVAALPFEVE